MGGGVDVDDDPNQLYKRAKAAKPKRTFGVEIVREGPDIVHLLIQTDTDHVLVSLTTKEAIKMGVDLIQAAWP